ncbi:conserved hypothetical protein [Nostocoides japonicum T1-X7]|uniref:N-acetyltransferase domain-containing protein n=1 Tax=Nostocoides japonicum T1-X7 TaxID=1194083 RepID=A0A077M314_9MICO|nr:GNAT family N-acetyltransferase [Tetrasphaera japonica]CCH79467.1 conserved hypothetical protein [Tetrasphaera japonica T1-X7]
MPALQLLRADHRPAVLAFERENRDYFAETISDRGDEYFDRFDELFDELLDRQEAGEVANHLLFDEDGVVLGRFNLYRLQDGTAEVGYRVAQRVAGRGVATAAVRELCRLAASRHHLHTLTAATSDENAASRRVLLKAGFVPVGRADPADLGGRHGARYRLDLTAPATGR